MNHKNAISLIVNCVGFLWLFVAFMVLMSGLYKIFFGSPKFSDQSDFVVIFSFLLFIMRIFLSRYMQPSGFIKKIKKFLVIFFFLVVAVTLVLMIMLFSTSMETKQLESSLLIRQVYILCWQTGVMLLSSFISIGVFEVGSNEE